MAEVSTCPMFVFNHLTRECIPNTMSNSVLGNTLCIASGKPFRPSTQHISYPEHLCFEGRLEPLTRSLRLHSWRHTYQEVLCILPCWYLRRCKCTWDRTSGFVLHLIMDTFCKDCFAHSDGLRLKGTVTITRCFYSDLTIACLHLLRQLTMTAVALWAFINTRVRDKKIA